MGPGSASKESHTRETDLLSVDGRRVTRHRTTIQSRRKEGGGRDDCQSTTVSGPGPCFGYGPRLDPRFHGSEKVRGMEHGVELDRP